MEIRTYSKKELAIAYAPNNSMVAALNRLALWLKTNHQLWDELLQTGYRTTQRYFNSRQVKLIFEYIGEPLTSYDNDTLRYDAASPTMTRANYVEKVIGSEQKWLLLIKTCKK